MTSALLLLVAMATPTAPAAAEVPPTSLSLEAAIEMALRQSPDIRVAQAVEESSQARLGQSRAGYLPRIDLVDSLRRSDNPVYVFGSLLTQERFSESNFAIPSLNRPDPLTNHQTRLWARQTIYDGGRREQDREAARLATRLAGEGLRMARAEGIRRVVEAYFGVALHEAELRATEEAERAARAGLEQARARRDAGMVTDADVLAMRVHLAGIKERSIRAKSAVKLGRAALNQVLGEPLDREYELVTALSRYQGGGPGSLEELDGLADHASPRIRMSAYELELGRLERRRARSGFLPSLDVDFGWEWDRRTWWGEGGRNWMVGLTLELNLFNGLGDVARLEEAVAVEKQAEAERDAARSRARLGLREAYFEQEAAAQGVVVAEQAVGEAAESHRITETRYEEGLGTMTELLASQTAALDARLAWLRALHAERLAAVALEEAVGTLTPDSEPVKP